MRTPVAALRSWGATPKKCLLLLFTLILITTTITPASAISIPEYTPYFNIIYGSDYGQDVSHYNTSVQLATSVLPKSTPWELWILSGVLSLVLFLYSLRLTKTTEELESSILVAAMAAVSAGYCAYSSFAIDKLMGYGVTSQIFNTTTKASSTFNNHEYVYMENHMIYAEPVIGMLMVLFFFVIVGYTLYRITRHKSLVSQGESE